MRASGRARRARGSAALALLAAGCVLIAGCGHASTQGSVHSSSRSTGSSSPQSVPAASAAGDSVTGSSRGVTATLHAASHHPKVGRPWPIRFTVTSAGHAARASVSYQYLLAGQVVAHRSHYVFTGRFSDTFRWPPSAVGYPLTLRAVIVSEGVTINLDFPVQVTA